MVAFQIEKYSRHYVSVGLAPKASVQWLNKLARVLLMVLRSDVGLMTDITGGSDHSTGDAKVIAPAEIPPRRRHSSNSRVY